MDEEMISNLPNGSFQLCQQKNDAVSPDAKGQGPLPGGSNAAYPNQTSPVGSQGSPQASVDETSLQKQRDKNKMSLKVKLMLRRPVNQLVEAGIMPPPKTPSAFFEQRRHLERARTGDILKTKIQKRPDRQSLVQQHILEDTRIAPSLHDRQRKLKRAKLADYLNDKIAHRPGPLELLQGNILKLSTDDNDPSANPVIDGSISFKKTSEGEVGRPVDGDNELDEEDGSSTASSPTGTLSNLKDLQVTSPTSGGTIPSTPASLDSSSKAPSPTSLNSSCPSPQQLQNNQQQLQQLEQRRRSSANLLQTDINAVATNSACQGYPGSTPSSSSSSIPPLPNGSNGHRRSKKCRIKPPIPQKTRTIKFHEYKGPPVVQNKTVVKPPPPPEPVKAPPIVDSETSYDILLKQQQLFLQWQLEVQQRCSAELKDQAGNQVTISQSLPQSHQLAEPVHAQQVIKLDSDPLPVIHQSFLQNRPTQHIAFTFPAENHVPAAPPSHRLVIKTAPTSSIELPPPTPVSSVEDNQSVAEERPKKSLKPEDLKVNDLKVELKKRSLPVSGSKTQLIERLKRFLSANSEEKSTTTPSPQSLTAESPPEIKLENEQCSSLPETPTVPLTPEATTAATFDMTRPPEQLSFLQLDPIQQQQATAIALRTLALQIPVCTSGVTLNTGATGGMATPLVPQIQNLRISAVPMEAEQLHAQQSRTVLNTLPTIFLATPQTASGNQVQGLTFQSTPLQMQSGSVPYIITMNGLNSTLNLINGFNFNAVINDNNQKLLQQQQVQPQMVQVPQVSQPQTQHGEVEQTSMQKLQQHLQQKILLQQLHKQEQEQKAANFETYQTSAQTVSVDCFSTHASPMSYSTGSFGDNGNMCVEPSLNDDDGMSGIQSGPNAEEDDKSNLQDVEQTTIKSEDAGNGYSTHCSYQSSADCIKSEAIDDVLEILIRNGELPPSAAQDALPKNLILQHPKPPLPHKSSSNSFYERRPSSHSLHFTDRASPPNNTCPLPPISSISPANHGSPASQSSESELTSIQQQLALLEYFNNQTAQQVFSNSQQVFSPQSQSSPQDASHYSSMEYYYSDPTLCHAENVPIEHNNSQNSQPMSDEDISTLLDGWLMDNGPFSDNSSGDSIMGRPGELLAAADTDRSGQVSPFRHEEMQADAFQDTTHHMDVESFLNANSSVDSMFDMFFSDLANSANGGGNGGYMTGGQNLSGPLYWPESEQML